MSNPIEQKEGPFVILAGAGTGKTRAMVEKVVYLIAQGHYVANDIVCVTFSNEAARSMESRIVTALRDVEGVRPCVRTFHALCADLLKAHGSSINIETNFRILTSEDAMIMLHKNLKIVARLCGDYVRTMSTLKDLGVNVKDYEKWINDRGVNFGENIEKELEDAQFELRTLHARRASKEEKHELSEKVERLSIFLRRKKFLVAWKSYEKLKVKKNVQDYADLNTHALELLNAHPELAIFKYVIVDEFQDTNKIQLDILEKLAHHRNITVVGDVNQSIYRFRGAYKDNLELFMHDFDVKDNQIYTLEKSHRSPNTVLRVAHQLISHNYSLQGKNLELTNIENKEGEPVHVYELKNSREEVRKVIEIVKSELANGTPSKDICVMFRTHQQANLLKRALTEENITYDTSTKKPLLKHDLIRLIVNQLTILQSLVKSTAHDGNAWWELIHQAGFNTQDEVILSTFLKKQREAPSISAVMLAHSPELSQEGVRIYSGICSSIQELKKIADKPVPELVNEMIKSHAPVELEQTREGREALLVLAEFQKKVSEQFNYEFFDLATFLNHLDVIRALELEFEAPTIEQGGIKIMTAHATKGLEYSAVILANFAHRKFPLEKASLNGLIPPELLPELKETLVDSPKYLHDEIVIEHEHAQQMREERRLGYVAFTRTKNRLYLTYARDYGKAYEPSPFLHEINYTSNPSVIFEVDNNEKSGEIGTGLVFHAREIKKALIFSPSALKLFKECRKKYEFKYVLNMPDPEPPNWEAMKLGSFVHQIIEWGVKEQFTNERSFIIYAHEEALKPEWQGLPLNEAIVLLKVFFARNKNKYNVYSKSEQKLFVTLENMRFMGIADRIDFHSDGLEIIDYKTGFAHLSPYERNWQLGLYALAAGKFGKVKRVTLDMLRHERPLEFDILPDGKAIEINTRKMSFNLEDVRNELIATAREITDCYAKGFVACDADKNCLFCNEYVY